MRCPVCEGTDTELFLTFEGKEYFSCVRCEARFLGEKFYLGSMEEYTHYLHHDNKIDDPGYRKFLGKLALPLIQKLEPGKCGLDYGCGRGPALAAMMEEAGYEMALYDPFFYKHENVLKGRYDFVTCSETVEHFHDPAAEFKRFDDLLKPGGWLGVMTCFQTGDEAFANWHYRRDPTHVVFYREKTFKWLAGQFGWSCEFPVKDVALMQKAALQSGAVS